jgi:hypothetical protein
VRYWEIIADNLSKAGWSWGCVATVDSNGQTIFVADARRDNGKRFIVTADEKLRAFLELQRVTRECIDAGWNTKGYCSCDGNFLQHRQLAAMIEIALIIIVVALCVIAAKVNQILKLLETENTES